MHFYYSNSVFKNAYVIGIVGKAWPVVQGHSSTYSFANLATALLLPALRTRTRKKWREVVRVGLCLLYQMRACVFPRFRALDKASSTVKRWPGTPALGFSTRRFIVKELQRDDDCTVQKLCACTVAATACTRLFWTARLGFPRKEPEKWLLCATLLWKRLIRWKNFLCVMKWYML